MAELSVRTYTKWTKELITHVLERRKNGDSIRDIAEELSLTENTVYKAIRKAVKQGYAPPYGLTKEIPDGQRLKGVSTLYDRTGNQVLQWVKSDADAENKQNLVSELVATIKSELQYSRSPLIPSPSSLGLYPDLMLGLPIGDMHWGMQAWAEETTEDYDLKIAEEVFLGVYSEILSAARPCAMALIVNLGDWFHYDNMSGTTERSGNILDRDGRYAKMVRVGIRMMMRLIDFCLAKHGKVHVVNAKGNHDDTSALFLSIALSEVYRDNPRVSVDTSPKAHHYVRWGKTLIGVHHGHTTKMDRLMEVMAADVAEDWGATVYRYFWMGHVHHQQIKEYPGGLVESFNTIAAKDGYAAEHGYRSGRNAKALIISKDKGEIARHIVSIPSGQITPVRLGEDTP
jgi:hypothetical protein